MTFAAGQNAPSARKIGRQVSLSEFARLWASDLTVPQIAERLGITRTAVQQRARRRGLGPKGRAKVIVPRPPRDAVARMWSCGVRLSDIAAHYGLSYGIAQKILTEFDLPRRPVGGQMRQNRMSLQDFLEAELARALAGAAAAEQDNLHRAGMVDHFRRAA